MKHGKLIGTLLLAAAPGSLGAQLRPLEPVEWTVLDDARWTVHAGGEIYDGQRASLAGTEGRLWELGTLRGAWRLGRVAFQVSGTAFRVFRDETVFADPLAGSDLRGTEDLSELRLGLRTHGSRWLRLTLVRGLTEFSPDYGLTLQVGFSG